MTRIGSALGLLALAASASSPVLAQTAPATSSLALYGLIDTGVEYVTNVGATSSSVTRMPNLSGSLPSRWGVRGTEDLGGGLKATFTLEAGFGPDSGTSNQGGRMFGRQAFVGLSGDFGAVIVGRIYSMLYLSTFEADQLGPNTFGLGSLDSYLPNAREDNAIGYRGTFSGLTVGATYSLGRDTVNASSPSGTNCAGESATDAQACRAWSTMLKYDDKAGYGLAFAADEIRGGTGAFAGLTSSSKKDRRLSVHGYANFGPMKLTAGVIRRDNDGASALSATNGQSAKSDLLWVGGAYTFSPAFVIDGQLQQLAFKNGGDKTWLLALRANYYLSKRTMVYATAGHIDNGARLSYSVSSGQSGASPGVGESQNGVMAGLRHSF